MKNSFLEIWILILVLQMQVICTLAIPCINPPYMTAIDSQMATMERWELTLDDMRNATLAAYTSNPSCDRITINQHTPFNYRTLCPWEYIQDVDMNRFPPVLIVAKCKCRSCFDNYQCKPVLYSSHVFMKQCIDGIRQWVKKTQLVSVACTCSHPQIHQLKKRIPKMYQLFTLDGETWEND